jgi:hypothetical protein
MGIDVELIIGDLSIAGSLRALPYALPKCPARSRRSPGVTAFPGHWKHETQGVNQSPFGRSRDHSGRGRSGQKPRLILRRELRVPRRPCGCSVAAEMMSEEGRARDIP